mgnify:CR=1 FL=1
MARKMVGLIKFRSFPRKLIELDKPSVSNLLALNKLNRFARFFNKPIRAMDI